MNHNSSTPLLLDPEWTPAQLRDELAKLAKSKQGSFQVSFINLGGAAALVAQLQGERACGWAEQEVATALADTGLSIRSRKGECVPSAGLAGDTSAALRQLFTQLNESAGGDRVVLEVAREPEPAVPPPTFETGLLSIVIRNHSITRLQALDEAIFSLATQSYRPFEIILVTQSMQKGAVEALEEVLERHRKTGGYSSRVLHSPSKKDIRARLVNIGLEAARGQYLAVLDDDDVVYPHHYARMIDALHGSDRAWALSPVRRLYMTRDANGELYSVSRNLMPLAGTFDRPKLMHDNYITCHAWVIDRSRIGKHRVQFEERLTKSEDYTMLLRLAALFTPVVITGAPSAEYRIRDDGTNTILHEAVEEKTRLRVRREWEAAIELKNQLTADLQLLTTRGELVKVFARLPDLEATPVWRPDELRYRLADKANSLLKSLPGVHRPIKAALSLISRRPKKT